MHKRDPATVVGAVVLVAVLGASGIVLGLYIVPWFVLFLLLLMLGLLIMLRPKGTASRTGYQIDPDELAG